MKKKDDKVQSKRAKTCWMLKKTLQNCFPYVAVYVLILSLTTLLQLLVSVFNKELINRLTRDMQTGTLSRAFTGMLVLYLAIYFLEKTSGFLGAFGGNFFRFNVDGYFRKVFMWKCSRMSQEEFFRPEFMDQFSLVGQHIDSICGYINNLCSLIFSNIGYVAGMLVLFAVYEPLLVPYGGLMLVFSFWLNRYISKNEYELNRRQARNQRREGYLGGLLTGREAAKEVRICHLSGYLMEKWKGVYGLLRKEDLELALKRTKLWNRQSRFLIYVRIPAVLFLIMGLTEGKYDIGTFVMLFGLVGSCGGRIDGLVYNVVQGAYKNTKYLEDYYDFIHPVTDDELRELRKNRVPERNLPFGKFSSLEVQDVSYTYPTGEKKAVDHVSLTIKKGEIVSILGYNGSGKTTLSKLMNGSLQPQEGRIMVNGKPLGPGEPGIFSYFGCLPQEYSRFSIPFKDHVGIGRIELLEEEKARREAYQKGGVADLAAGWPQGEDTILGKEYEDRGINLSGGEWQRVVLASAHMGDPEILLLDEPSASVDSLRENAFLEEIRGQLEGRTAVLISHRIAFARLADRIILMKEGRIAEEGTHEELVSGKGYYQELFERQKELYEDGGSDAGEEKE